MLAWNSVRLSSAAANQSVEPLSGWHTRSPEHCPDATALALDYLGKLRISPCYRSETRRQSGPQRLKGVRKKSFRRAAFPQRMEAAVDWAAVTARVELVPFPSEQESGVFPQPLKPCPSRNRFMKTRSSVLSLIFVKEL